MVPSETKRQNVIVIVGATASGKTALSIKVARAIGGEIISADSRQVYRGLDIGSGKITADEMKGVPHHLLDVAEASDVFTASDFVQLGAVALADIRTRNHVPIIVGGTGFYIDALLRRVSLADVPPNESFRLQLSDYSLEELQEKLRTCDPTRYETVDIKNPRRLVRAIEIAQVLGTTPAPPTKNMNPTEAPAAHHSNDVLWIGLTAPPEELKKKIHIRLFARICRGMLEEAQALHKNGLSYERMDELGLEYRYMARRLRGDMSHEEMTEVIEKESYRYAKRQMTWFKKNKSIHWFAPDEQEEILMLIKEFIP